MKRLVVCSIILSISVGCIFLAGCSNDEESSSAVVSQVSEKNYVEAEGTIISNDKHVITSDRNGKVTIDNKVGQEVSKDQVLVTYDDGAVLKCPYNRAVITEVCAVSGEAAENGKKLISLSNVETTIIKADVLENYIKDIKTGANVKIIPNADKNKTYRGKVTSIGNCAVKQTNGDTTINVEISIDDKDDFLHEGYTVSLEIDKE